MANYTAVFGDIINIENKPLFPTKSSSNISQILPFYSTTTSTPAEVSLKLDSYWKNKNVDSRIFSNLYNAKFNIPHMRIINNEIHKSEAKIETFPSSEHYFQAAKYSEEDRNFIMLLSTGDCARYGQRRLKFNSKLLKQLATLDVQPKARDGANYKVGDTSSPVIIPANWDTLKLQVMYDALIAKFSSSIELAKQLTNTEGAWLIEHTQNDSQWGDGGDGSGKNYLGKMLMIVREEIRSGNQYFHNSYPSDEFLEFMNKPMTTFIDY